MLRLTRPPSPSSRSSPSCLRFSQTFVSLLPDKYRYLSCLVHRRRPGRQHKFKWPEMQLLARCRIRSRADSDEGREAQMCDSLSELKEELTTRKPYRRRIKQCDASKSTSRAWSREHPTVCRRPRPCASFRHRCGLCFWQGVARSNTEYRNILVNASRFWFCFCAKVKKRTIKTEGVFVK